MSEATLRGIQEELHRTLEQLDRRAEAKRELAVERASDPMDDLQRKGDQDLAILTMNSDFETRKAVRAALNRMEEGDYGLCESCGDEIGYNRLKALPWATLCRDCKEAEEESLPRVA